MNNTILGGIYVQYIHKDISDIPYTFLYFQHDSKRLNI